MCDFRGVNMFKFTVFVYRRSSRADIAEHYCPVLIDWTAFVLQTPPSRPISRWFVLQWIRHMGPAVPDSEVPVLSAWAFDFELTSGHGMEKETKPETDETPSPYRGSRSHNLGYGARVLIAKSITKVPGQYWKDAFYLLRLFVTDIYDNLSACQILSVYSFSRDSGLG